MITRDEVYNAIDSERDYQDKLWPMTEGMELGSYILMLEEYVARARTMWTNTKEPEGKDKITDIVRKIGGISVRAMEEHGAPLRQ